MLAIADMICISFFFLCPPGEHSLSAKNIPFCTQDMRLYPGANTMMWESMGMAELDNVTAMALTFTAQKNCVKGKIIQNNMTGDPYTCPA